MHRTVVSIGTVLQQGVASRCREVAGAGGLIAYPTDTFYGLGVDPRNPEAIRRLFLVKGREKGQPILILIKDAGEVVQWAESVGETAEVLMRRYWPGPLTLVLNAKPGVPEELTAGTGMIGLRVPGNAVTRQVLEAAGGALTGTSANRSGGRDARTAAEVYDFFGEAVDLILDGGPATSDKPSTVVDVSGRKPRIIRPGAINVELVV